jgi:aclacinomycin oxidase
MSPDTFAALLRNFGTWHERNSAPGSPGTGLYAVLMPNCPLQGGSLIMARWDPRGVFHHAMSIEPPA